MLTFIILFAGLIIVGAGFLIANGANQRRRAKMAGHSQVEAQQAGSGAPTVGRAQGRD